MQISKKIELTNHVYYVIIDVEYKMDEDHFPNLYLKNNKDDYWDGGDCSHLIQEVEKNYTPERAKYYDNGIHFMSNVIYIYDRIPFISGVKEIYISKNDNIPYSEDYISKEEIENYIKEFNIKRNKNDNFRLMDERTWKL